MHSNTDRVRQNATQASTEDLMDRVTVYRRGMESDALAILEEELRNRGVDNRQIDEHARQREREVIWLPDGTAATCSFCYRPAVARGKGWHRLWGLVPVFPRGYYFCSAHQPAAIVRPNSM